MMIVRMQVRHISEGPWCVSIVQHGTGREAQDYGFAQKNGWYIVILGTA